MPQVIAMVEGFSGMGSHGGKAGYWPHPILLDEELAGEYNEDVDGYWVHSWEYMG